MMIQKNTSNRKRFRSTLISLLLMVGLGLSFVSLAFPQALQAQIPENLAACIPTETRKPIDRADPIANYTFEGETYHLLSAFEVGESAEALPTTLVIKTTEQGCEAVFFNPGGETVQLASTMPLEVARHLTLGLYEHQISKIGIEQFKTDILEATRSATVITWFDEEIWALQQLGIPIPENVQTAPLPSSSAP
jgi:hypothetical protein